MTEWRMVLLLVGGPLLWLVGGTWWKPARRFVWPAVVALAVWRWEALLVAAGFTAVNCLAYGDRTSYGVRLAVFASYALPVAFLDWRTALVAAPFVGFGLLALMWASRWWNRVTWKLWEATAGFLQAVLTVLAS